jgi:hypothetical protein
LKKTAKFAVTDGSRSNAALLLESVSPVTVSVVKSRGTAAGMECRDTGAALAGPASASAPDTMEALPASAARCHSRLAFIAFLPGLAARAAAARDHHAVAAASTLLAGAEVALTWR